MYKSWLLGLTLTLVLTHAIETTPATLTTLPPAIPSSGSTDPCNFTDRYSLLNRIETDWQGYNISLLVAKCPSVCPLVYGSGNPDISGVGAMVSYILQGATTFLFGPLLSNFMFVMEIGTYAPTGFRKRLYDAATDMSYNVAKTNVFVSFSVAIAVIVRTTEVPPLSENEFMSILIIYENMVMIGALLSMLSYRNWRDSSVVALAVYEVVVYVIWMTTIFLKTLTPNEGEILSILTSYCMADWDYPVPYIEYQDGDGEKESQDALIFFGAYLGSVLVIGILVGLAWHYFNRQLRAIWEAMVSVGDKIQRGFMRACVFLHIRPRYHFYSLFLLIATGIWVTSAVYLLIYLEQGRAALQLATGDDYQDSDWGFGQITAVLAWAPVLHDLVLAGYELWKSRTRTRPQAPAPTDGAGLIANAAAPGQAADADAGSDHDDAASVDLADQRRDDADSESTSVDGGRRSLSMRPSPVPRRRSNRLQGAAVELDDLGAGVSRRSTGMSAANPQPGLAPRQTWPRNDDGTYLPTARTSGGAADRM